jgi:hypothetical protein
MRVVAATFAALATLAFVAPSAAEAQARRNGQPLVIEIRPRSYFDAGTIVQPGELNQGASPYAQTRSYLNLPPWHNMREAYGAASLPDPIHGTFIGAESPFRGLDFGGGWAVR